MNCDAVISVAYTAY